MTPPCKAVEESDGKNGKEFLQFDALSHVSGLKVESALFQMAEKLPDAPAHAVKSERFAPVETVADYDGQVITAVFSCDFLFSDEQRQAPHG